MAANFMSPFNGLSQGKVWVRSGMDLNGRSTRGGQNLLIRHSQREDINWVRWNKHLSIVAFDLGRYRKVVTIVRGAPREILFRLDSHVNQ